MRRLTALVVVMVGFLGMNEAAVLAQKASAMEKAGCEALRYIRNLTVVSSEIAETESGVEYCYVRGVLPPAIHFHVQLPFPRNWNGRFLQWGDGGKDGDLDFADHRVGDGYAVANSNTGHDNGAVPGSSFGHNNRQAEIDFGYRAVHLTVMAAKTLVQNYFGKAAEYSYFEGCSTGGRQGLMAAQRYPADFDGIVAGAPANYYQEMNAVRVWLLQRMFRDNLEGALGFDTDSDGRLDSTRKINILAGEVLKRCDVIDGIEAEKWGLGQAVADEHLDDEVENLAHRMATIPRNQLIMQKMLANQVLENMGFASSQTLATIFDGIARHSPEGINFKNRAEKLGWKKAVQERDEGNFDWTSNRPFTKPDLED